MNQMLTFNHSPLYHFVQKINEICSLTLCTNDGMISISMKTFSQNNFTAKCPFSKITSQIQLSTTFLLIHENVVDNCINKNVVDNCICDVIVNYIFINT